jgi:hypothetical protein
VSGVEAGAWVAVGSVVGELNGSVGRCTVGDWVGWSGVVGSSSGVEVQDVSIHIHTAKGRRREKVGLVLSSVSISVSPWLSFLCFHLLDVNEITRRGGYGNTKEIIGKKTN